MAVSFTVEKKGEVINFDSAFTDVEVARQYLKDCMTYSTFAMSLATANKLSDKQVAWIHYLATQNVEEQNKPKETGEFLSLVEKMYKAVKTKSRKFTLHLPLVTISTVTKGVNVGCLYISENGDYVGKITSDGVVKANLSEDAYNLLLDANDNLLELAKVYGHETGCCSVCGRTLSDPLSIQMGIGPICAERFQ